RARGAGSGRRPGPATTGAPRPGAWRPWRAGAWGRRPSPWASPGTDATWTLDGTSWWPRIHRNTGNIHHIGILLPQIFSPSGRFGRPGPAKAPRSRKGPGELGGGGGGDGDGQLTGLT